ncbi:hypothetical protein F9C07_1993 [Aspergillus flavus]|uniref:Uncharacterized protein n=1 Tax=Aspergillus flavus (strain ATCC 200026 / FGSC A1120 / IAM 13836 / NRRL 3357 / JCM 12722 / SRRC 167) TaxID=332952 RepID=A0A7U2MGW3_ASPFN|nr:hypothetical protein F9C07_1993 [Aspergillus flavus]
MQNKNRKREEMLQTGYGGQYGVGMTATGATVVIKKEAKKVKIQPINGDPVAMDLTANESLALSFRLWRGTHGKKDWQRKQSFPGGEGPDDRPWDWPLWVLWREKWRSSFIAIE